MTITTMPAWTWEVDVTNDPSSATTTWTDITPYVRDSFTIRRGRERVTSRDQAGTATLSLYNGDRRFDFFNTSGPYGSNFKPMRRIRARATYASVTYSAFSGFIDFPELQYPGIADALTTISATDGFKVLANSLVSGAFPAQRADLRVGAILDAIGWPSASRVLAVGVSFLDPITLDKVSALEHLQQVAESESGRVYMDPDNNVKFINRHTQYQIGSSATFGEQEILYQSVGFSGSDDLLFNDIFCQRLAAGSIEQHSSDATSKTAYLIRALTHSGMHMNSDNEAKDKCDFELSLYKDYHPQIVSMALDGIFQPSTVWPQALGFALSNRITIRKRPPGGGTMIEQLSVLEGIEHVVGVGSQITTFRLGSIGVGYLVFPAGKAFFVLDDATNGVMSSSGPGVLTY